MEQQIWTSLVIVSGVTGMVLIVLLIAVMNQEENTIHACQEQNVQMLASFLLNKIDMETNLHQPNIHIEIRNSVSPDNNTLNDLKEEQLVPTVLPLFRLHLYEARVDPDAIPFQHFLPIFTSTQYSSLMESLQQLDQLCSRYNFTYMLFYGTLLGSYRHHDLIPWADDLDVLMPYAQKSEILNIFSTLPQVYMQRLEMKVQFYHNNDKEWKWPYIQISFYKENDIHIWDGSVEDEDGNTTFRWLKADVFPLHKRPLGTHFFNAPHDTYRILVQTYVNTWRFCYTTYNIHRRETSIEIASQPCEALSLSVPFVHRSPLKSGVLETLMIGKRIIHSIPVKEPEYAITKPYGLELF